MSQTHDTPEEDAMSSIHPLPEDPLASAQSIGTDHGEAAGDWWAEYAIGGRCTLAEATLRERCRAIIEGIEDGDPAILDALPHPDLSGQRADGHTSTALLRDTAASDEDAEEACAAYEAAYQNAVEATVSAAISATCPSVWTPKSRSAGTAS